MALKITTDVKQVDRQSWEDFVMTHPDGNIFQMPCMFELHEKTRRQRPAAFFAYEEGRLAGLMVAVHVRNSIFPFSFFTRRQLVVGGPLVRENDMGVLMALLEALAGRGQTAVFTEIKNLRLSLSMKPTYEEAGFYYESYLSVVIDMNRSSQDLWESLSPGRKENIERMKTADYTISDLQNVEQIDAAWRMVRCTIGKTGRPTPDESLFLSGFDSRELKSHLKFKGLMVEGQLKAVILVLIFRQRAYVYYEGNSLLRAEFWMYDGLVWAVIQELQSENIRFLHLGTAGRPGKDFYTRQYKKSYGGMIKETGRYVFVYNWFLWNMGRAFYQWYKRIRRFFFRNYCKP